MAVWAIGDVQGCWKSLRKLLRKIDWDPETDEIRLCGDLVNRGPRSLDVLRWAREHDVTAVLGNHDLHLLRRAAGLETRRRFDSLDEVLEAEDGDELIGWLRRRPLLHDDGTWLLVHAGILPEWSRDDALARARRIEKTLRGKDWISALERRGHDPGDLDVFTRLRMVDRDGVPDYEFKGSPRHAPKGLRPWYDRIDRKALDRRILFGHWAALGFHESKAAVGLDTGCVWGGALTAYRLEDGKRVSVDAVD